MDFTELATRLINEVEGVATPKNVEGVVDVLKGVMIGVHNQWEQHLAQETNDLLMSDKIECDICSNTIQILRTRTLVDVKNV